MLTLSVSLRHDFCMSYSWGSVRGSDAVAFWSSYEFCYTNYVHHVVEKELPRLASIHGMWGHGVLSMGLGVRWVRERLGEMFSFRS
jgi:hypothetical protein